MVVWLLGVFFFFEDLFSFWGYVVEVFVLEFIDGDEVLFEGVVDVWLEGVWFDVEGLC